MLTQNMLELHHVSKSFGTNHVLKDLSFTVPEHSIFGFIGQNGAGKTTTMKMILGLLKIDSGNIIVNNVPVTYGQNKTNQYIGYLPDVPEFYGYMKPMEYLTLCGKITGLPTAFTTERAKELLTMVGLGSNKRKISGFSRGMKQRLGIAQALLHQPKLLICDEPTSALDPMGRKELLDILKDVSSQTTVLFSTHILSDVERICDRIAVLNEGSIAMHGTLNEIKESYKHDTIEIEFSSPLEKETYLNSEEFLSFQRSNSVVSLNSEDPNSIQLKTSSVYDLLKLSFLICYHNSLAPRKTMVLEPTLENLFMEVIKA